MALQLLSVIESPRHPNVSHLYANTGIDQQVATSIRKALKAIKKAPPDILVAEFIYGYGNNYAGVNISNLDVLLVSLQLRKKKTRVILFADKAERQYVDKLETIHPVTQILEFPVNESALLETLLEIRNQD